MMDSQQCQHRVRFSMSDESGTLRFTEFEVKDQEDCSTVRELTSYLLERPAFDIDWEHVARMSAQSPCTCAEDVLSVLGHCREILSRIK